MLGFHCIITRLLTLICGAGAGTGTGDDEGLVTSQEDDSISDDGCDVVKDCVAGPRGED